MKKYAFLLFALMPLLAQAGFVTWNRKLPIRKSLDAFVATPRGYLALVKVEAPEVQEEDFMRNGDFHPVLLHLDGQLRPIWAIRWLAEQFGYRFEMVYQAPFIYVQGCSWKSGGAEPWIACVNEDGRQMWLKSRPRGVNEHVEKSALLPWQNNLLSVIRKYARGNSRGTVYLQKLDREGNVLWESDFGTGNKYAVFSNVAFGMKGTTYVMGHVYPTRVNDFSTDGRAYLAKIDPETGKKLWERTYDNWQGSMFREAKVLPDGNLEVLARVNVKDKGRANLILKLSPDGDVLEEYSTRFVKELTIDDLQDGDRQIETSLYALPQSDLYLGTETTNTPEYDDGEGFGNVYLYDSKLKSQNSAHLAYSIHRIHMIHSKCFIAVGKRKLTVLGITE